MNSFVGYDDRIIHVKYRKHYCWQYGWDKEGIWLKELHWIYLPRPNEIKQKWKLKRCIIFVNVYSKWKSGRYLHKNSQQSCSNTAILKLIIVLGELPEHIELFCSLSQRPKLAASPPPSVSRIWYILSFLSYTYIDLYPLFFTILHKTYAWASRQQSKLIILFISSEKVSSWSSNVCSSSAKYGDTDSRKYIIYRSL